MRTSMTIHNVMSVVVEPDGWLGGNADCHLFRRQNVTIKAEDGYADLSLIWDKSATQALPFEANEMADRIAEQAQTIFELRAEVAEYRRQALARDLATPIPERKES